ncbi:MAG: MATE family efflux transporter [Paludibacteraceae bacterium]|nr:MATE family efflux transporter [Paludibacteraceae bacterium]MBQ6724237.1 MATE family efflux transporter [Paludibacteraceae bacterium]
MTYSFRAYYPYYKRNLKLAFPVMLTQFGAALVGLADSIMVGHYGTTDLAAVSFSNALFFTVMVFAMGALMGITPLVGHVHGRLEKLLKEGTTDDEIAHKHEQITSYFTNGLVFTGLMCVLSLVLLAPCIGFLDAFGQEPEVVTCARPYYILIVLSIVPFLLFTFSKQFLEGLGNTTVAMLITIGCNLLNILLNWVFIFGHWGCQPMGAEGAGWASLIARCLMPVCYFIAMLCKADWRRYLTSMRRYLITRREVEHLLTIGMPIGLQSFAEAFLFTASFVIIGWISKESLAAHHIANQMADLTFMLALGIGSATTIRVSHQLGKGDLQAVRMASHASVHLCLLMNTIGAAIMIFGRNVIPYIFTSDPEVIPIASTLLVIAGTLQYADGLQCIGAAMLRGIQDVRVPMRIALFAYIGVALPLGIYLTFYYPLPFGEGLGLGSVGLGAKGMWIAFVIALAIPAVLFHVRFHRQMKRLKIHGFDEIK